MQAKTASPRRAAAAQVRLVDVFFLQSQNRDPTVKPVFGCGKKIAAGEATTPT
jgi:hypothetical protein